MNPICLKGKTKKKLGDQVNNLSPPALFCWSDSEGDGGAGEVREGVLKARGMALGPAVLTVSFPPSWVTTQPGVQARLGVAPISGTGAKEHLNLNRSPGTSEVNRRCLFHVPQMPLQFIPRLE